MWTLLRNLLFLLLLTTPAHAKWVVIDGDMKIAVLFEIEEGDEVISKVIVETSNKKALRLF